MNSVMTSSSSQGTIAIGTWLGLNEAGDEGLSLKTGEASVMRNFRVGQDGNLEKRPGMKTIMRLWKGYDLSISEEKELLREWNVSTARFTCAPYATAVFGGKITLSGDESELTEANSELHLGEYFALNDERYAQLTSGVWRVTDKCVVRKQSLHVDGGWITLTGKTRRIDQDSYKFCDFVRVRRGKIEPGGNVFNAPAAGNEGKFVFMHNAVWQLDADGVFRAFEFGANDLFCWWGKEVEAVPASGVDTRPAGFWSGCVNKIECMVAACGGKLWSLENRSYGWVLEQVGSLDTSKDVCMFGFGGKLYVLAKDEYYRWDGSILTPVQGYVPCLAVGCSPNGGGTLYERVNKLSKKRSQRFSADGNAKTFVLLEKSLASVDMVTVNGSIVSGYTADLANGKVTFTNAPAAGIDNVQIYWSVYESTRGEILGMRKAELYNGVTDTRVFLYGDTSNRIFYSDVTASGEASAEYFPELNVCHIGAANTPVTGLLRHYDRLLAFKSDSTYSISYDAVTLADGTVTGGFYVRPINRSVGNCAMGQVLLAGNRPRSLDGRSIYEWIPGSTGVISAADTNAHLISQRVEKTLSCQELKSARCFWNRLTQEYFCIFGSTALVHNIQRDIWYEYADFPIWGMVEYRDETYVITQRGEVMHLSGEYAADAGRTIKALWVSGRMSIGRDNIRKYVNKLWLGLVPGDDARVTVGLETVDKPMVSTVVEAPQGALRVQRVRLKAHRSEYMKLSFSSDSEKDRVTIASCQAEVSLAGEVR